MKKGKIIFLSILILIVGALAYLSTFRLKEIQVTECHLVSEEQVKNMVKDSGFMDNTIILYIKNKVKPITNIPFASKIDIDFVSKNKVVVTVYEKSVAGCIEYMNSYVYFDKDGIVLESTVEKMDGVPCIEGLSFQSWEMEKKLPIDDKDKFSSILTITQLIEKYELQIDGIEFTSEGEIILHHEGIEIEMGEGDNLAVQMMNLGSILEGLKGKQGTLYMKDYNSDNATASFKNK